MDTCIITPTYFGDFDQFSILRKTILSFAPQFKHLVVVESEDFSFFHEHFGCEKNIEIIKTSEVLPSDIELRRKRESKYKFVRSIKKRFLSKNRHIDGWRAQQLSKIYCLQGVSEDVGVFIDSDVFLCNNIRDDFFRKNKKTKLFYRPALNAEQLDFDISTHEILGHDLYSVQICDLFDYVFQPACFNKRTAHVLMSKLCDIHGSHWQEIFLNERRPSEFNLLGYAARELEQLENYEAIVCSPEDLHGSLRYKEDEANLQAEIDRFMEFPKDFFLIQSTLKIPTFMINKICGSVFDIVAKKGPLPLNPEAFASLRRFLTVEV